MEFSGFDWDRGNLDKCQKHGVSIREIESLFSGAVLISPDLRHSQNEERLMAFGTTVQGRKLLVAFMLRRKGGEMFLRPVSVRYMHRKEVACYEKEAPRIEE